MAVLHAEPEVVYVAKIYEDFSNDDLIDQLINRTPLGGPAAAGAIDRERTSPPLAVRTRVKHDTRWQGKSERRHHLVDARRDNEQYSPLNTVWYCEEDAELVEQPSDFILIGSPN